MTTEDKVLYYTLLVFKYIVIPKYSFSHKRLQFVIVECYFKYIFCLICTYRILWQWLYKIEIRQQVMSKDIESWNIGSYEKVYVIRSHYT